MDTNGVMEPKERDTNDTKTNTNDTNKNVILSILQTNPKAIQKD